MLLNVFTWSIEFALVFLCNIHMLCILVLCLRIEEHGLVLHSFQEQCS